VAEPLIRVLVTGGRDYTDRDTVARVLAHLADNYIFGVEPEDIVLVHGDCKRYLEDGSLDLDRSTDQLAAQEAADLGWQTEPHPVLDLHYRRWGKAAPLRRNQAMVDTGANYCVVFPGGNGTAHCKRAALDARIPVIDVQEAGRG